MNERDLRARLTTLADDVPPPAQAPAIARRARRRVARTVAAAAACIAVIATGSVIGARALMDAPRAAPVAPPPAAGPCDGPGMQTASAYGTPTATTGRYPTNIRNLNVWLLERHGPDGPGSTLHQSERFDGSHPVMVCTYEGRFQVPISIPAGATLGPQTALSIMVIEGEPPRLDGIGHGPFEWAYTPAPPGCHRGEAGCDPDDWCEWETDAPHPCGSGVTQGRAYRYTLYTHCGIRHAWFDGRLWTVDPRVEARGDTTEGTMTLVSANEARFDIDGGRSVTFRPHPDGVEPDQCR